MAWLIVGAGGVQWHAADWVQRNAFELLVPALRKAGNDSLAEHCRTAIARGARVVDLSAVLSERRASEHWRDAVRAALHEAQAESAATWHEGVRQPDFIAAVARLDTLALGGGNAFIVDLARNA